MVLVFLSVSMVWVLVGVVIFSDSLLRMWWILCICLV